MSDPFRQVQRRSVPFPGSSFHSVGAVGRPASSHGAGRGNTTSGLTPDLVKTYLIGHHDVLQDYVMEFVRVEELEQWLKQKQKNSQHSGSIASMKNSIAPKLQPQYLKEDISSLQRDLLNELDNPLDQLPRMYAYLNVTGMAVRSDGCTMYTIKAEGNELCRYCPKENASSGSHGYQLCKAGIAQINSTIAGHVAHTRKAVLVKDILTDDRFPKGIGVEGSFVQSVLCVPFTLPSDDILCVYEFIRRWDALPFSQNELQIAIAMIAGAGNTTYQTQMNNTLVKQSQLNDFLLEVSRVIFDDVIAMDDLVRRIMMYTKELVQADRCTLFLVDHKHHELYADLFDEGRIENGNHVFTKKEGLRFPISKGIAGHVARTGEVINIPEAYRDQRFNRDIDLLTGYTTHSILCMPIISKTQIIGVVQMINKSTGEPFTNVDESAFKMFAVYCALALRYSKVYTDIQQRTAQYKVALEQMNFHIRCSDAEEIPLLKNPLVSEEQLPKNLDCFLYYGPENHAEILPQLFIQMCINLLGPKCFDLEKLCHFVMTVKKNYRPVAYHNWKHGFNVAHCVYVTLMKIKHRGLFPKHWMKALLIGSLCHDVDHRGYNNSYFTKVNEPLATLYPTSVMEQHHYAHTVTILQQENHDIFSNMSAEEYKETLGYIRHAIIATDLALFFPMQKKLAKMVLTGEFDLNNEQHLQDSICLLMTASDLCAVCKPWHIQTATVELIYEEFYVQGDLEKSQGLTPLPMMDRENLKNRPQEQVGFIKFVCQPCYQTLADIFEETSPLLQQCQFNFQQWELVALGKTTELWQPAKSWVKEKPTEEKKE